MNRWGVGAIMLGALVCSSACGGSGEDKAAGKVEKEPVAEPAPAQPEAQPKKELKLGEEPVAPSPVAAVEPIPGMPKVETQPFDARNLPEEIKVKGKVVGGARWSDGQGDHMLVLTEVAPKEGGGAGARKAELYGYQYDLSAAGYREMWKIQDFINDCELDITLSHMPETITITDLDQDGEAESAFIYRLACRSDVSPADQKLMMHEGAVKYALRGTARISLEGMTQGGAYEVDKAFNKAPPAFLKEAKRLWKQYEEEKIGG